MNLLITGAWKDAEEVIPQLKKEHNVAFLKWEKDKLPCSYEWIEGVIGNGIFLYHPIEEFTNLRYIQLTSAGYDRVPMDYVQLHKIEIHNAKGVYSIPMAEFALTGVLQIYKQSRLFQENQKMHKWERNRDLLELYGKTVCIVGCGDVGDECAKRFQAFGCHVIGVNRSKKENNLYEKVFEIDKLKDEVVRADIMVLTIALTEETRHLIDRNILQLLKKTAILVNLARGAIVDTEALIEILPNIKGAVLDVFEEEPLLEENVLWNMKNVIVTPHNSFIGNGNTERLKKCILYNLAEKI